jgi:hypothetical protein
MQATLFFLNVIVQTDLLFNTSPFRMRPSIVELHHIHTNVSKNIQQPPKSTSNLPHFNNRLLILYILLQSNESRPLLVR